MVMEVLRLENVTTIKGNQTELDGVSLRIPAGRITGLLPINTYGLDSLLDILLYNAPVYYGHVYYCEKRINSWREERKGRNPVTLIDGNLALVEGMSVAENLCLFRPGKDEVIRKSRLLEMIDPFLSELAPRRFGIDLPLESPVEKLDPLQCVVTEILRAVMLGHRLIILREIGALLSEEQLSSLSGVLRHYTGQGFAFLYISMHFEEICSMCTHSAIFNNGTVEMTADLEDETQRSALDASIYRVYTKSFYKDVRSTFSEQPKADPSAPLLEIGTDFLPDAIRLHQGECLALQFLDTRPYQELVHLFSTKSEGNTVRFSSPDGKSSDASLPAEIKKSHGRPQKAADRLRRIAFIPENAPDTMIFPGMSVMDNLCMNMDHLFPEIWRKRRMRKMMKEEYIRITGRDIFDQNVSELSREDRTQLIYMRIRLQKPLVLIAEQPFKGADVSLRQKIWELLERMKADGIAVLILTVSMSDSLTLADRVIRIGPDGQADEYNKDAFSKLPPSMPWTSFYRGRP